MKTPFVHNALYNLLNFFRLNLFRCGAIPQVVNSYCFLYTVLCWVNE